jgi:hypothetical protein
MDNAVSWLVFGGLILGLAIVLTLPFAFKKRDKD